MAKRGQPTKYKPEYCQEIITFFDIEPYETTTEKFFYKNGDEKEKEVRVPAQLPFFSAFARKIGVCHDTLCEWCKVHPDFSEAYKRAKELQKEMLINNGLMGLYNATAYIFTAKNIAGMRDKTETVHDVKGDLAGFLEQLDGKDGKPPSETEAG